MSSWRDPPLTLQTTDVIGATFHLKAMMAHQKMLTKFDNWYYCQWWMLCLLKSAYLTPHKLCTVYLQIKSKKQNKKNNKIVSVLQDRHVKKEIKYGRVLVTSSWHLCPCLSSLADCDSPLIPSLALMSRCGSRRVAAIPSAILLCIQNERKRGLRSLSLYCHLFWSHSSGRARPSRQGSNWQEPCSDDSIMNSWNHLKTAGEKKNKREEKKMFMKRAGWW